MSTGGHGEGAGSDRETVHLTRGLPAVAFVPCPSVLIVPTGIPNKCLIQVVSY